MAKAKPGSVPTVAKKKPVAKPLGVPGTLSADEQGNVSYEGYSVTKPVTPGLGGIGRAFQRGNTTFQQNPRYFTGDEQLPATWQGQQMIDLQSALEAGGFYTGDHVVGVWNDADVAAYKRALQAANRQGAPVDDIIKQAAAAPKVDRYGDPAGGGQQRAPLRVQLTNDDDLRAMVRKNSSDILGGNLSDEDTERFVSTYHQMEMQGAQAQYDVGGDAGGAFMGAPDPGVALENQIRADHPNEVAATAFGSRMDDIISTFTGQGR
jgi:hypothetical protein